MHDLVIRGGTIVDGTGKPAFDGDVAVSNGLIAEVGKVSGRGRDEIDAKGAIVTPGTVDVHTHYDGQVTWDSLLSPSANHGVTTVVTGNCGVGFAPIRPGEAARRQLIELMEGVEDIPGTALWEGIDWSWESFPEYLDSLERRKYALDVSCLVPHGALRVYVMGDRGARQEDATREDINTMARLVEESINAGAVGFSTSRILSHQSTSGDQVPGTFAGADECMAIGRAVARAGGLFQLVPGGSTGRGPDIEFGDVPAEQKLEDEIRWLGKLSRDTGVRVTYMLAEHTADLNAWRDGLNWAEEENQRGAKLRGQVGGRALGLLLGFEGRHMFERRPTYMKIASLPFEQRIRELSKAEVRAAILGEKNAAPASAFIMDQLPIKMGDALGLTFALGSPVSYEPRQDESIDAEARRRGIDPQALAYDLMMEQSGRGMLMLPAMNYARCNEDALHDMLSHPQTVVGFGDGGAHCSVICDGSMPTYMLSHWVKGRKRGPRLPLELAVHKQTGATAGLIGLHDRGRIARGLRADINVIDLDHLRLLPPRATFDLPAGGMRMLQEAQGYLATLVAGTVVRRNDTDTGSRPGRLVRLSKIRDVAA